METEQDRAAGIGVVHKHLALNSSVKSQIAPRCVHLNVMFDLPVIGIRFFDLLMPYPTFPQDLCACYCVCTYCVCVYPLLNFGSVYTRRY